MIKGRPLEVNAVEHPMWAGSSPGRQDNAVGAVVAVVGAELAAEASRKALGPNRGHRVAVARDMGRGLTVGKTAIRTSRRVSHLARIRAEGREMDVARVAVRPRIKSARRV
jgi:hypothetical protein